MNRPDRLTAITIATLKVVIVAYYLAQHAGENNFPWHKVAVVCR
jgi:hypothetical protein